MTIITNKQFCQQNKDNLVSEKKIPIPTPIRNHYFLIHTQNYDIGNIEIITLENIIHKNIASNIKIETNCTKINELNLVLLSDIHCNKKVREINTVFIKILSKNNDFVSTETSPRNSVPLEFFVDSNQISSELQIVPWDCSTSLDNPELTNLQLSWLLLFGQSIQTAEQNLHGFLNDEESSASAFKQAAYQLGNLAQQIYFYFPGVKELNTVHQEYCEWYQNNEYIINSLVDAEHSDDIYSLLDNYKVVLNGLFPFENKILIERIHKEYSKRQISLINTLTFLSEATDENRRTFCIAGGNHFYNRAKEAFDPYVSQYILHSDNKVPYALVRFPNSRMTSTQSSLTNDSLPFTESSIDFFNLSSNINSLHLRRIIRSKIELYNKATEGI